MSERVQSEEAKTGTESRDDAKFRKMTETDVGKLVVTLGIPTTISMLVTSIYNMADTAFVGTLGNSASGAIGVVFGYMAIIQAIGFMFGQGSGSMIARLLGQHKTEDASRIASTGFLTAMAIGLLITEASLFLLEPLLLLLGSTDTILPYAKQYCFFIALGAPFIICGYVMNNILRFEGLAIRSMVGLVTGALINIALDPLFIMVFKMGTAGAGLATFLSQVVSFSILLSMFIRRISQSEIHPKYYTHSLKEVGNIIAVGFPSLVRQSLGSLGTIMLNQSAKPFGDEVIAAMSIANRVSMFLFSAGLGLGQGYQPVCSFNFGAKRYDRVRKAYFFTLKMTVAILGFFAVVIFLFAPMVVRIFRDDPAVIPVGTAALRFATVVLVVQPFSVLTNMTLQSSGKALSASILATMRSGVFFIPILLIFKTLFGVTGIEMAQPVADVLTALVSLPFIMHYLHTYAPKKKLVPEGESVR